MGVTMSGSGNQTIQGLVGEALRESTDLAQKEFSLFRSEMTENIRTIVLGLVMFIAAAVFAIGAIIFFTGALVDWLATVVGSRALASLIVGGVLAIVAIGLGLYGRHAMSASSLAPKRTVRSLKRDAEVLSERVTG